MKYFKAFDVKNGISLNEFVTAWTDFHAAGVVKGDEEDLELLEHTFERPPKTSDKNKH